jgi:hypothetical protein
VAILDSGPGADYLITSLLKARSLTLYRLFDEALSDLEVTNAIINGLHYRGATDWLMSSFRCSVC